MFELSLVHIEDIPLSAGAGMVHTNTYQASPEAFVRHMGLSETEALDVIKSSVKLCERAVQEEGSSGNNRDMSIDYISFSLFRCVILAGWSASRKS